MKRKKAPLKSNKAPHSAYQLYFRYYKNVIQHPSLDLKSIESHRTSKELYKSFVTTILNTKPDKHSKSNNKNGECQKYIGNESFVAMSKTVSQKWREADSLTRSVFEQLASEDRERYNKEIFDSYKSFVKSHYTIPILVTDDTESPRPNGVECAKVVNHPEHALSTGVAKDNGDKAANLHIPHTPDPQGSLSILGSQGFKVSHHSPFSAVSQGKAKEGEINPDDHPCPSDPERLRSCCGNKFLKVAHPLTSRAVSIGEANDDCRQLSRISHHPANYAVSRTTLKDQPVEAWYGRQIRGIRVPIRVVDMSDEEIISIAMECWGVNPSILGGDSDIVQLPHVQFDDDVVIEDDELVEFLAGLDWEATNCL